MRVVFLGNDAWSVPALDAVADDAGLEVALVVTNPVRPAGRGSAPTPTPVADRARARGLPLAQVDGVRDGEGLRALRDAGADALAVVAYGELLTPEVLDLAREGAVNLHFSLLPRWRGAAPVQHALLAGDPTTGVTTMLMDRGLDTGPVLEQRATPILPDDDAGSLGGRLAGIGAELLVHTLRTLSEITPRPQDPEAATSAPKLRPVDRELRWDEPAERLVRVVRAFAPAPGGRTTFRGQPLNVLEAEVAAASGGSGEILTLDADGVVVAAGEGAVRLREVAPAGRRHMGAVDWARGARFAPGERLG